MLGCQVRRTTPRIPQTGKLIHILFEKTRLPVNDQEDIVVGILSAEGSLAKVDTPPMHS